MAAQQNSYVSAKKYIIVSKSATKKLGIVSENSILETSVTNVCVISEFINGGGMNGYHVIVDQYPLSYLSYLDTLVIS